MRCSVQTLHRINKRLLSIPVGKKCDFVYDGRDRLFVIYEPERIINNFLKEQAMKTLTFLLTSMLVLAPHAVADPAHWANWRGPDQNGVAAKGEYPLAWSPDAVLWKTDIPGKGFSTPVVWDKTIYMTTGAEGKDTVVAVDWSGNVLWQTPLGAEVRGRHQNASGSNSSPVTDGSGVFVVFKSGTLAALELDGKIRWQTNLFERFGRDDRFWDFGSSPALTKTSVIMAQMHDGESWVAAFDKTTGDLSWKVSRDFRTPTENSQSYNTPIVFSHEGKEALLIWGAERLTAHDAADGQTLWSCGKFNPENTGYWPAVASPVICGDVAVVSFGRADRRQPRLHGVKLGGSGDVSETHRLWMRSDIGSFVPTSAAFNEKVYVLSDRGELECIDPATGKKIWGGVIPDGRGSFYTSPLIAGGHLYAARETGIFYVVKLNYDGFEVISTIDMKDRIIASPIALLDRLLIRTEKHLFCIAGKP